MIINNRSLSIAVKCESDQTNGATELHCQSSHPADTRQNQENEYGGNVKNQMTKVLKPCNHADESENGESDELVLEVQHKESQLSDSFHSEVVLKTMPADEFGSERCLMFSADETDHSISTYVEAVKPLVTGVSRNCKVIPNTNKESLQYVNNEVSWEKSAENRTVKAADEFQHDIVRHIRFPEYASPQNKHQSVSVEEQCMIPEINGKLIKTNVHTSDPTGFKGTSALEDDKGKYPILETSYGNAQK